MTPSRRSAVQSVRPQATTNASLWLDKYFDQREVSPQEKTSKETLVDEIANEIQFSTSYNAFYQRWHQELSSIGAVMKEALVLGRLAINLGSESVLETSIALHHTYGVPFIPGSALKGLAAHYIKHLDGVEWRKGSPAHEVLFGNTNSAGYVTFFDALYIPGTGFKGKALWPDVITVHHPDYYQAGKTPPPPADWDSPDPIPFLSATGKYLVALLGPVEWVEKAFEILGLALDNEGIGAKTSSGYGRMKFDNSSSSDQPNPEAGASVETFDLKKRRILHENPPAGRFRGTVSEVNTSGRYGKINPARGGSSIFVHINQINGTNQSIVVGQVVEYQMGVFNGKDQAQDVIILLEPD